MWSFVFNLLRVVIVLFVFLVNLSFNLGSFFVLILWIVILNVVGLLVNLVVWYFFGNDILMFLDLLDLRLIICFLKFGMNVLELIVRE